MTEKKKESVERLWTKACGEALMKNLDFVDIMQNVKAGVKEIADKHEVDDEQLTEWFMNFMTSA